MQGNTQNANQNLSEGKLLGVFFFQARRSFDVRARLQEPMTRELAMCLGYIYPGCEIWTTLCGLAETGNRSKNSRKPALS